MRIILLLFILSIISCKSEKPVKKDVQIAKVESPIENTLEGISPMPESEFLSLFENATYTDYIFHTLPFAISQDNKASVQANLKMIEAGSPDPLPKGCQPLGRQFFHIGGDIKYEADVYFSEGCVAYVFKDGNKTIYANGMTKDGRVFFANLLKQASNVQLDGGQ